MEANQDTGGEFSADAWAAEHVVSEPDLDAPAYEPEPEYDSSTPDVGNELRVLNSLNAASDLEAPEQAEPEYPEAEYEETGDDLEAGGYPDDDNDLLGVSGAPEAELQVLDQITEGREQLQAERQQFEQQVTVDQMGALVERYPELGRPGAQAQVRDALAPLVERYGPQVASDPGLIEVVHLANRALLMRAQEVSPDAVRHQGATLERAGGASAPTSEDPDAQFKRDFLSGAFEGGVID